QGGGGNKWKTPNHEARRAEQIEKGTTLGVGDAGIWVTYARGQRPRGVREFIDLCEVYGEEMYGLKPFHADATDEKEDAPASIEDSIAQELQSMQEKKTNPQDRPFTSVNTGIECVFFLKTRSPPINAIDLTIRMCEDARKGEEPKKGVRTKYINRLVPVVDVDRSSDAGMERLARDVMGKEFALKEALADGKYAIRHNIRHNKELRSDELIKKVAGYVDERHKVNLTQPDKVILVEVFQFYCGMSVVDGKQWEELKRYNLNEM
ncbi:hypothetical protein CC79DRAFT_1248025, partial [Sarocladium strictum]